MKSKITTFIMSFIMLILIGVLAIFAYIIYQEFGTSDLVSSVQNFVTEATVGDSKKESLETPGIIETSTTEELENANIDYSDIEVNKYFYNQLDNYSKTIYNAMESNKENMKSGTYEINFGNTFSNLLSQDGGDSKLQDFYQAAIDAYLYDNPDVFYLDPSKMYLNIETTTKFTQKTYKVFINSGNEMNYLSDAFQSETSINNANILNIICNIIIHPFFFFYILIWF